MSCEQCEGTGLVNGEARFKPCIRCDGEGKLRSGGRSGGSFECTSCRGSGQKQIAAEKVTCKKCKGTGRQDKVKEANSKSSNDTEGADGARSSGSTRTPQRESKNSREAGRGGNGAAKKRSRTDDDKNEADEENGDVEAQTVGKSRKSRSSSTNEQSAGTLDGNRTITCTINVGYIGSIFSIVSLVIGLILVIRTGSSLGAIIIGSILLIAGAVGLYFANKDKCSQAMEAANRM